MADKYDPEQDFERYEGRDKPRNPKGIFVIPTGSVSVLNFSASIKGGTVGSTKDTKEFLSNITDGDEYEEPWHEAIHYLDKRVTEISNGVNKLADAQSNLSGSSATAIATNKAKTPLVIGTRATEAKAGNTTTISGAQASAITANSAKTGISTSQANSITSLVNASGKGITNSTGQPITFGLNEEGALTITVNRTVFTISGG